MIISSPSSVAFEIFGFPVYFYGITMALAVCAGIFTSHKAWKKYYANENSKDLILDLAPWLVMAGFAGARIYYCLLNFGYYSHHLTEIFNLRQGGLSIHGMFIACLLFLLIYAHKRGQNLWNLTAPMVLGVSIAQSIGRWGNFFNSEAFGKPYDGFIKLYIAPQYRPAEFIDYSYFHPTFLWESLLDLVIFVVLLYVFKRSKGTKPLFTTSLYFFMYGIVRIFVENLRIDSALNVFNIPIAVIVSSVIIVLALIGLVISIKKQ